jgi:hypothetical protein
LMSQGQNLEQCAGAYLLAIAATARPRHDEEPIPREEMEAINKLVVGASPKMTKTILRMENGLRQADYLAPLQQVSSME